MFTKLSMFFCLLLGLFSCNKKSRQDNGQPTKIISKQEIRFEEETKKGEPFDFDFTMVRTNYSDSSFTDGPLICSDDTAEVCKLNFKVLDGFWYIKADNEWQEFYNPQDSLLKVVYFRNEKFILKPIGHSLIYNKKVLWGFEKEDLYVYTSEPNVLYFHPDFGVVAIGYNQTLVRVDFKEKSK